MVSLLIGDSSFVNQMVEWARWVVSWQCETMNRDQSSVGHTESIQPPCKFPAHSEDCPFSCKPNCGTDGPVFIIMIDNDKVRLYYYFLFRTSLLVDTES